MKIYAVIYKAFDSTASGDYDIIRYFSQDKEKCEKFIMDNKLEFNIIKELESETTLKYWHQINW